jgi:hypothetical protein
VGTVVATAVGAVVAVSAFARREPAANPVPPPPISAPAAQAAPPPPSVTTALPDVPSAPPLTALPEAVAGDAGAARTSTPHALSHGGAVRSAGAGAAGVPSAAASPSAVPAAPVPAVTPAPNKPTDAGSDDSHKRHLDTHDPFE